MNLRSESAAAQNRQWWILSKVRIFKCHTTKIERRASIRANDTCVRAPQTKANSVSIILQENYKSPFRISSAKYSEARIVKARIVSVGF